MATLVLEGFCSKIAGWESAVLEVDKTDGEELCTESLMFLCLAHSPYGICTYRSLRHGLAQYIHAYTLDEHTCRVLDQPRHPTE